MCDVAHERCERRSGLLRRLRDSTFIIGLLSIGWLIIRTGRKPSRIVYPCQQAALTNGNIWLATYVLPFLTVAQDGASFFSDRRKVAALVAVVLVASAAVLIPRLGVDLPWGDQGPNGDSPDMIDGEWEESEVGAALEDMVASSTPASEIFAISGAGGGDGGFSRLIDLMGDNELLFYQSDSTGENQGPEGLIAPGDVVLIKVNCQWDERGGTNTDLLREVIQAIVDHPDGFTGEIVVSDNGQGEDRGSLGRGGSFTYPRNNAEDRSQSVQAVADSFAGSHRVSTYLWSDITEIQVEEYSKGDYDDGYVVNETRNPRTEIMVSYAKFTTEHGTRVSFKHGIWDSEAETYDDEGLKVINVPVLKSHQIYGVTGCVKHYMGVPSDVVTSRISGRQLDTHLTIGEGGMGTLMVETRYPVLNILDVIWSNVVPLSGPMNPDERATRLNVIAASTDPAALDYWSSKHILHVAWIQRSNSRSQSMDPDVDELGYYGRWLRLSMQEIQRAGYQATVDENQMNVHVVHLG